MYKRNLTEKETIELINLGISRKLATGEFIGYRDTEYEKQAGIKLFTTDDLIYILRNNLRTRDLSMNYLTQCGYWVVNFSGYKTIRRNLVDALMAMIGITVKEFYNCVVNDGRE